MILLYARVTTLLLTPCSCVYACVVMRVFIVRRWSHLTVWWHDSLDTSY